MSKAASTTPSASTLKESLQRPGLRQIRSSAAVQALSGVRTKATLAPSSTVTRRTKTQHDTNLKEDLNSKNIEKSKDNTKGTIK